MIGSDTLLAHLRPLIRSQDGEDAVAVVAREPPRVATHHVSEILTVRCASDRMLMLLIKYDTKPAMIAGRLSTGARYEALVYERVLTPLGVTVPACYGVWRDADSGATVLARAYVNAVKPRPGPVARLSLAAAWIGRLHALAQPAITSNMSAALNTYTKEVYHYWAVRTRAFERRTQAARAWLSSVIDRLDPVFDRLLGASQTVIHGDFYTDNTVYHDGRLSVFDWEETAIAPGEIDLATLTYDWHDEVVQACEASYCRARWPEGAPASFADTLEAARVFVYLRLLGEARGWPNRSTRRWRVELLRRSAGRMGLL